ncbi:deoxyribose-phosphate aldolase [Lentiprolixibacter aurantiacus]|uniref:Deoxyribose-phosphate aldolase n=1 Tax=Lentiprolixibacter aurantiacus TaxID=2993939 RepID=A0AAE3MKL6_9FLAO|nr:deoxyribose-phosphate aldolase [Lentiprolixibacter aurantiacus]MCX2718943.1 deoxyribose-phosphate aldolase [Lentiprolixibacter aurantiacus]
MLPLEKYIDHTLLKATATPSDIESLCEEALYYGFYAVCVNSTYLPLAREVLDGSQVRKAAVIGFPLGATATPIKLAEAEYCLSNGADELDMVINIGRFKSGHYSAVREEISKIKSLMGNGQELKVIIETCYLSEEEIQTASRLVVEAGGDFVKTSTGFGSRGASPEDISLIREIVGNRCKIKASGGIRDRKTALMYIEQGVHRIGASAGVAMMKTKE